MREITIEKEPSTIDKLVPIFKKVKKDNLALVQAKSYLKCKHLQEGAAKVRGKLIEAEYALKSHREEISPELYKTLMDYIVDAGMECFNLIHYEV